MMSLSGKFQTSIKMNIISKYIFRDTAGSQVWYEAISVIQHMGRLSSSGESGGHYVCDVKDKISNRWFRTNDDCTPIQIRTSDVSKNGYVVLFKRV